VTPVTPGTRVGPYEVVGALGAGAMGEVYRARDARLGRDVALKVLPAALRDDRDRLARFDREARALAALNHPHIAALYGVEDSAGESALVMELVEGETLADRLRTTGPLPVHAALDYARQIASALDAAHESGIVHRDLKPANIKITPSGVVKVLDFGLAKAAEPPGVSATSVETVGGTGTGAVLGTAAYMSPEQARGQAVDKRADIWAFGCVLFEMLAGRRAFAAETVSDTIARVLNGSPDWTALPGDLPPAVRAVLERCLARDVARRLRDLGDFEPMITVAASEVPTRPRAGYSWVGWLGAGAAGLALGWAAAEVRSRPAAVATPQAARIVQFDVPVGFDRPGAGAFSLAPDGGRLAYVAGGPDGALRLWLRDFAARDARPVSGTEREVAFNTSNPIWAPDGRALAFYSDGRLKRVDSSGGTVETVCALPGVAIGGTWSAGDEIVVGRSGGGLLRCPAAGGAPVPVTVTTMGDELHLLPQFLPGGNRLIYLKVVRSNPEVNGLYVADLSAAPEAQPGERLVATGFGAFYVPARDGTGRIVMARDRALWALRFDPVRLTVEGEPERIAEPVGSFLDGAFFSVVPNTLAHRGDPPGIELVWYDRRGRRIGRVGEPGSDVGLALAPDGSRAAVLRNSKANRADQDVWLIDVGRDSTTRLTVDPQLESVPTWNADGTAVIYAAGHDASDILMQAPGADPMTILRRQTLLPIRINPLLTTLSPTPDRRAILFSAEGDPRTRSDLWMVDLEPDGRVRPVLQQEFDQSQAVLSPDGRWLAHVSNESGVGEVFVRRFALDPAAGRPTLGPALLVSRGGGRAPRWRSNSRELFYQSDAGAVMAAPMSAISPERPTELFRLPEMLAHWGVAPDGERFLLGVPVTPQMPNPIRVVLNWQDAAR